MIRLTLTPGLWMTIIVTSCGLNYLIGECRIFRLPRILIEKYSTLLFYIFNAGEDRRIKGLLFWILVTITVLALLITIQFYTYNFSSYLAIGLDIYLLTSALGERKLYKRARLYYELYDSDKLEELQEKIEDFLGIGLNISSRYGMTRG